MKLLFAAFALLQQQGQTQDVVATLPASPVARIAIAPTKLVLGASDSMHLTATAYDAAGKPIPNARLRFSGAAANAGVIDSAGWVFARGTGKVTGAVISLMPGYKPIVRRFEVVMVPDAPARITIGALPARLAVGQRVRATADVFTRIDDRRETDEVQWTSSAPSVARVNAAGLVTALKAGTTTITATDGPASVKASITVVGAAIANVAVTPSTLTARTGDVIRFAAAPRDAAGRPIGGLTPSWSFAPGKGQIEPDGAFVAYEPGTYVVTANYGARSADAVVKVDARDVRRPVRVVGRLPRLGFPTSEVWIHPNGTVAYLGTHGGGDRLYTIDISNPSSPKVVDSIQANTRLVNDMMTTPDGNYMVFTREGASDRKNGIVIADTHDPLHPKAISEFTDGVTGGVHSTFVYRQPKFGTHIYLTNDATGAIHVIDINDPVHPKQVGLWKTPGSDNSGRYVHDIDVRDGILYGSWWNDGLVMLDVGNGIKGGSPSEPKLISQFKYDLDKLYRDVEAVSGPGFTRGTHTAWRHKNYVFIADEVYRNGTVAGAKDAASSRMYGTLQVVDVSDIEHPRSVASYTPEYGGVHNVWVAGDTLYMGAYDGGFHVFDISGELRGDLRAQGREIGHLNTADMEGFTKNAAFTWGVVVNPKDGLAYVNDFNNGLWIVKVEARPSPVP
ncbi:MAG TPA: Ig-like domain-containing protein [Gemmatimonadaceae bacterium]|nr:Ig-like domain-containing protein [Gemmatimonadaceae bacterium]